MSKKTIHLLIVLAALLLIFLYIRFQNRSEKQIRYFDIDSVKVARLDMFGTEGHIVVIKEDNRWQLIKPMRWEINDEQINQFFSKVLKVKVTRSPMSQDMKNLDKYRLTPDKAVTLKIYDKRNRLLDEVYFGRSLNSSFCYARRKGENAIYQLKDNIYDFVVPSIYLWRSHIIAKVDLNDLAEVDVKYISNSYKLFPKGQKWYYQDAREYFELQPTNLATTKIFNALTTLQTYQFLDHHWKDVESYFKKPAVQVTIKDKKGQTTNLSFAVGKDNSVYLMKNGDTDTIYMMTLDMLNRFTIAAQHFKEALPTQQ